MTFHSLRFDRAASTYGHHAQVQAAMAETLIGLWPGPPIEPQPNRAGADGNIYQAGVMDRSMGRSRPLLEMGCGTGLFTRKLMDRFRGRDMVVTDAAPRMLAAARGEAGAAAEDALRVAWELFDASGEAPVPEQVIRAAPYALAASAAMVQWFPRLESHFRMVGSLLAQGGAYLVSGFSRDNFPELNAILAEPPFAYPDYPGHDAAGIHASAEAAGFTVEAFREDSLETAVPSPRAFLELIRGLGSARRPASGKPMTQARLAIILERYQERYSCEGGVRATWKPWYALLRKPSAV
ncbi:MAG: class I SAM-dependent methyltransferase [Fibrobacteria bacterium]